LERSPPTGALIVKVDVPAPMSWAGVRVPYEDDVPISK
jgi:hypothetical protein